ncbi:hypothetical protein SKAU_G00315050 [Synaphobranchus kaupii]|uniref:Uncharacterized protein n=1 Tax=Synaphobranchus kaupii TaxID=118154 RepID=A0A9Q1ESG2_SYNKA|nr:hypothetical protein SKAU_G00315050 [Synaphobranchus kaupii]
MLLSWAPERYKVTWRENADKVPAGTPGGTRDPTPRPTFPSVKRFDSITAGLCLGTEEERTALKKGDCEEREKPKWPTHWGKPLSKHNSPQIPNIRPLCAGSGISEVDNGCLCRKVLGKGSPFPRSPGHAVRAGPRAHTQQQLRSEERPTFSVPHALTSPEARRAGGGGRGNERGGPNAKLRCSSRGKYHSPRGVPPFTAVPRGSSVHGSPSLASVRPRLKAHLREERALVYLSPAPA